MTPEPPPVHIPGWGALLADGTHIPQPAIDAAVELLTAACAVLEALAVQRDEVEK